MNPGTPLCRCEFAPPSIVTVDFIAFYVATVGDCRDTSRDFRKVEKINEIREVR